MPWIVGNLVIVLVVWVLKSARVEAMLYDNSCGNRVSGLMFH